MRTLSNTRQPWMAGGLSGLADGPRRGAPARGALGRPSVSCTATRRSHGRRLNVVAALLSNGTVISAKLGCAFTAPLFAGFVAILNEQVTKPLTVILDNASVHTSRTMAPLMAVLSRQGVTLYFRPPYSPELNRIEKRCPLVKHRWMAPKHCDA